MLQITIQLLIVEYRLLIFSICQLVALNFVITLNLNSCLDPS